MTPLPVSVLHGLSFLLGLIFGSFVTALSYRLPRGQNFMAGRSRCSHCATVLQMKDLVPVLSWVANRGRCRHCGADISPRYPVIELICGCLFLVVSWLMVPEDPARAAIMWIMAVVLLSLTIIDIEYERLPNGLVLLAAGIALALIWLGDRSVLGAVLLSLIVFFGGVAIRFIGQLYAGKPGLGWGDIKLAAALGLAVPIDSAVIFLGISGILAVVLAVEFGFRRHRDKVPLGPALCAGTFAALL